jgi:hypothetical protein
MTISINQAVLLWNSNGKAHSEPYPLNGAGRDYRFSVGAVCADYKDLSDSLQLTRLLVEAIQSIVRDGVEPKSVLTALARIEGMAELFAEDCHA